MKSTIKIIIAFFVLSFGFHGCYEEYVLDFDYTSVYFGAQRPIRTLVTRTDRNELVFKIGVGIGGIRENVKGYEVEYELAPELLLPGSEIAGASRYKLLPENCYTIENDNDFTFYIKPGKIIGDCQVRINKNAFVSLEGATSNTWALPFRLTSTTADKILEEKDWTIIVIRYIDEHSGDYLYKGWQAVWNGTTHDVLTRTEYDFFDKSLDKARTLTTISQTEFTMAGMGNVESVTPTDHLFLKLEEDGVKLERLNETTNLIENLGSSYNPQEKTFTLDYVYARAVITTVTVGTGNAAVNYWAINGVQTAVRVVPGRNPIINSSDDNFWILEGEKTSSKVIYNRVNEQLKLRQDVEIELRFQEWVS